MERAGRSWNFSANFVPGWWWDGGAGVVYRQLSSIGEGEALIVASSTFFFTQRWSWYIKMMTWRVLDDQPPALFSLLSQNGKFYFHVYFLSTWPAFTMVMQPVWCQKVGPRTKQISIPGVCVPNINISLIFKISNFECYSTIHLYVKCNRKKVQKCQISSFWFGTLYFWAGQGVGRWGIEPI